MKKWGRNLPHFWDKIIAVQAILLYAGTVKTARTADSQTSSAAVDIPSLLRERLRAATRRNPRFSLRSFAKQLGIDHSTLSQVLRSKRRLSARALEAICKRLGLSEEAVQIYKRRSKKNSSPNSIAKSLRSFHLDLDTFQLLSVWYHYAILELIEVQGFKADSRWIAKTLGIPVEDVNVALQRLLRLGLLEMSAQNRWIDKSGDAEFQTATLTDTAANQINHEVHELAMDAIRRIPGKHRMQTQMMVALDSRKLPQLRKLAGEFMDELRSLASETGAPDDVYQIEISLFPVTTLKRTTGEKNG